MTAKLAINGGTKTVEVDEAKFVWPRITQEAEAAVVTQLHKSISIYDRSGVFGEFEDAFASYHDKKLAILSNSGTSAIFSMFEAIGLMPGDEVIAPVYTFHATVSPLIYTGAVPVFADCDDQGSISFKEIKTKFTNKTKAVIVTHMWGTPIKDIELIGDWCSAKGIYLLEDCSHAHGARIHGRPVGSFGSAAAWSIQGPKTITGGEGGVFVTDDRKLFNRALLQGHYNKRPKNEIPSTDVEAKYYLSGLGLKLRAHPLAIALAAQQFEHLDEFISQRQTYAEAFTKAFEPYPFLKTPQTLSPGAQNSWYAYVLQYDEKEAFGVSKQEFADALIAEGLVEVDIPGSTGLINDLPLFTSPQEIMPRLYSEPLPAQGPFPNAIKFHQSIIKIPVWAFEDEYGIVDSYIEGIVKVCDYLMANKALK